MLVKHVLMVSVAFSALVSNSYAMDCNELAPGLTAAQLSAGSGEYYELNRPDTQPDNTQIHIDSLRASLAGNWKGTLVSISCNGSYRSPHKKQQQYTVDAEIETTYKGDIRIEMQKESSRSIKLERVFLSPDQSFSVANDDNTWTFIEKYRTRNKVTNNRGVNFPLNRGHTGHTLLWHQIKKVQVHEDSINISRHIFVNGLFVAQDGWLLQRS